MKDSKWPVILLAVIIIFLYAADMSHTENEAYDKGYESGYSSGEHDGNIEGYDEGYEAGYADGSEDAEHDLYKIINSQGEELCAYEDISYCVVFVTPDGYYHHFTCKKLGGDFWDSFQDTAYDIEHAKQRGYIPCPNCIR